MSHIGLNLFHYTWKRFVAVEVGYFVFYFGTSFIRVKLGALHIQYATNGR